MDHRLLSKRSLLAFTIILASIIGITYLKTRPRLVPGQAPLTDIRDIKTLQEQFNRDVGQTRLILLVSPT
jgi:hypothetical protein